MKKYLFPFLYTLIIILVGSFFTSILYYFNITSDKFNTVLLYLISIISFFTGALFLGKNIKKKGIISGLIFFGICFLIMILSSLIIFKNNITFKNIIYYLILLVFSIMGSIIGKNTQTEIDTEI